VGLRGLVGFTRSGLAGLASASLAIGRKCAGIAGGRSDAPRSSAPRGMLRGDCDGNRYLRGRGGDAAVVWAEYWVFVLPKMEAGFAKVKSTSAYFMAIE